MNVFDVERGRVFREERLSALRAYRDSLLRITRYLDDQPSKEGYLLLVNPSVSSWRLKSEFAAITHALRPDLARRIRLLLVRNGKLELGEWNLPEPLQEYLPTHSRLTTLDAARLPRANMQAEVLRFLLLQWFLGRGPMTTESLSREVGCSYRTVVRAIGGLGNSVERGPDRRIRLKGFPRRAWDEVAVTSKKIRNTITYTDHSDQPRSLESLYRRIARQKRTDLAFGGVLGARDSYPSLDSIGTPRLDICIHAFGKIHEPLRLETIDPGLRAAPDPERPVRIAVHHLRRKSACFTERSDGTLMADPVECLLDLVEAGLDSLASSFLSHLESRARDSHE